MLRPQASKYLSPPQRGLPAGSHRLTRQAEIKRRPQSPSNHTQRKCVDVPLSPPPRGPPTRVGTIGRHKFAYHYLPHCSVILHFRSALAAATQAAIPGHARSSFATCAAHALCNASRVQRNPPDPAPTQLCDLDPHVPVAKYMYGVEAIEHMDAAPSPGVRTRDGRTLPITGDYPAPAIGVLVPAQNTSPPKRPRR